MLLQFSPRSKPSQCKKAKKCRQVALSERERDTSTTPLPEASPNIWSYQTCRFSLACVMFLFQPPAAQRRRTTQRHGENKK
jgi:hypothetical protein